MSKTWDDVFAMFDADVHPVLERWRARGDGAAVYENKAFDSYNAGHLKAISYGSEASALGAVEPPERMPDTGSEINWAYQLVAAVRE